MMMDDGELQGVLQLSTLKHAGRHEKEQREFFAVP